MGEQEQNSSDNSLKKSTAKWLDKALKENTVLCAGDPYITYYKIRGLLGSGGYGITYLAEEYDKNGNTGIPETGRKVAVKELFPNHLAHRNGAAGETELQIEETDEEEFEHMKKRFYEEAQKQYELKNITGIVDIKRVFEENGTIYYVMELLDGMDLKQYVMKNGVFTWEKLSPIIRKLLAVLREVHSKGIIHRDISPDNIFLLKDGTVKLIDFGNARTYVRNTTFTAVVHQRFAPVEQFQSHSKQGPHTDIFAVCSTMYFLLSGKLPVSASDRLSTLRMSGKDPLPPINTLCPDLPRHVCNALQKGMEIDARNRVATVSDLQRLLYPEDYAGSSNNGNYSGSTGNGSYPGNMNNSSSGGSGRVSQNVPRMIFCVAGALQGARIMPKPGQVISVGRGSACMVSYPENYRGVSHRQCSFTSDNKGFMYVRDDQSRFGTYLDGKKLPPMIWTRMQAESQVRFNREIFLYR